MTKKFHFILILTILLSLPLIAFWLFVLNNLNNLKNENSETAKELEVTERKMRNIKNLEILFNALDEERQKIRASVILKEDLVGFIENLESLAAHAGADMQIRAIQIEENSYPVLNIESSGDFNEVYYFIEMLESLPYFVSFDRLTIQENSPQDIARLRQGGGKEYKWTSKIDIRVLSYYDFQ